MKKQSQRQSWAIQDYKCHSVCGIGRALFPELVAPANKQDAHLSQEFTKGA